MVQVSARQRAARRKNIMKAQISRRGTKQPRNYSGVRRLKKRR